jgi:hypothetical protein
MPILGHLPVEIEALRHNAYRSPSMQCIGRADMPMLHRILVWMSKKPEIVPYTAFSSIHISLTCSHTARYYHTNVFSGFSSAPRDLERLGKALKIFRIRFRLNAACTYSWGFCDQYIGSIG